jgi:4-hydroxybutyrate CoA-transferase
MKYVSLAEAAASVRSGQRIYLQGAAATPQALIGAIVARSAELTGIETVSMHTEGPAPFAALELEGRFRHNALFIGANVRRAVQEGRADYTPIFLSEIPDLFAPGGPLPLDIALLHVTPPDERGYCSLGVSVDCALAAAEQARLVIAQVNPRMPRTGGHQLLASSIHLAVAVDDELLEATPAPQTEESAAIGRHVAELVADGSTLQLGIGAVPDAVVASLSRHRDLGLHTEMFSDGVLPLIQSGVINGARKTIHPGVAVSAFVLGSRRLYDFVDNNHRVELHPVSYTNDVDVIAANARMVAINSALSVDLTGQVAADSVGPRFYSGIGGQVDFIRGAARSPGGVPVIALPSTAASGTISRICPELVEGSGVTTTRGDVHWVVTEYGARNLHGRTIRDRARMLIEIAHPKFRGNLFEAAGRLGYLGTDFEG